MHRLSEYNLLNSCNVNTSVKPPLDQTLGYTGLTENPPQSLSPPKATTILISNRIVSPPFELYGY